MSVKHPERRHRPRRETCHHPAATKHHHSQLPASPTRHHAGHRQRRVGANVVATSRFRQHQGTFGPGEKIRPCSCPRELIVVANR